MASRYFPITKKSKHHAMRDQSNESEIKTLEREGDSSRIQICLQRVEESVSTLLPSKDMNPNARLALRALKGATRHSAVYGASAQRPSRGQTGIDASYLELRAPKEGKQASCVTCSAEDPRKGQPGAMHLLQPSSLVVIATFSQGLDEHFCEACERYKALLKKRLNHRFDEVAQLNMF
ncbi:hypothetical protein V8G54_012501 [Vigna mungo]|uniref:Uncharacterized protein n=1 Tax=Vigna mungo TaxID=3915 RepID=A0AAQ3NT93_VIGMU